MAVEGALYEPPELRIAPALVDVPGDGVAHHPGNRPTFDLGYGTEPFRELGL